MNIRLCLLAAAALVAAVGPARGDGPGAYRPPERAASAYVGRMNELKAIDAYNEGYAYIQRAEHYEIVAEASNRPQDQSAARSRVQQAYEDAVNAFERAVGSDPSMHQAHTYLGYAHRKLGRHTQALKAYQAALKISPAYAYAIEYQGEAFLGLNRINDAKLNYLRLYAIDQAQAHKLLRAMRSWVDAKAATPPEGMDLTALSQWIIEREVWHDPNETTASW